MSTIKTPYLSVIIPSYNESENLQSNQIDKLYQYLKNQPFTFEILLVDDGSTDSTLSQLKQFQKGKTEVKVISNSHQGKAPTVAAGMLQASGENRLFTDFDQATPIEEIEKLLPFREKGHDIIIGSREVKGAKREKEPVHRHIMGRGFNLLVKILMVSDIHDTQCGFKLFSKKATLDLFPSLSVYKSGIVRKDAYTGAFDVELLFLAHKRGYSIAEVPVIWKHVKTNRVDPLKDSIRMFIDILKIKFNELRGQYNN